MKLYKQKFDKTHARAFCKLSRLLPPGRVLLYNFVLQNATQPQVLYQ
jgi:hypothetical protein